MTDELITLLAEEYGLPVKRQGSLSPREGYPAEFFTFWNNETESLAEYDNLPHATAWSYDVNFYGTDPARVMSVSLSAADLLRNNGWIIDGKGYDVPSDEITHTGRGFTAIFREREVNT